MPSTRGALPRPALPGLRVPRRALLLTPVVAFGGLALALGLGLGRDPGLVPSALIGRPVPPFRLPPVQGRRLGLAADDLRGEVSLVNVFASWCVACREEHPLLLWLQQEGLVPVHGLNYKDQPEDAARWLDTMGDPYTRTGADRDGRNGHWERQPFDSPPSEPGFTVQRYRPRIEGLFARIERWTDRKTGTSHWRSISKDSVAIDWGVYGVPETFVVAADGTVAFKQIGAVTPQVLSGTLLPLVRRLRG